MRPFWRYYGGKFRASGRYPNPVYDTIVEPFAGASGYSTRHWRKQVVLVDKSPIIAGIWRYLIATSAEEIRRLPLLEPGQSVDDLDVCQEAKWLIGFWCNNGNVSPCKTLSKWAQRTRPGRLADGWNGNARGRIARGVDKIRHWQIIEGEYHDAPDVEATWYVDPPYSTPVGRYYPEQPDCFDALGRWCRSRRGQVIVCEQDGASWLPFEPFGELKSTLGTSREVVWMQGPQSKQLSLLTSGASDG